MAHQKSFDTKNALRAEIPDLTIGVFVRSASVANLLVAMILFVDYIALAVSNHDGRAFFIYMVFWLIPFVTLVIWGTAALLLAGALTRRRLRMLWRRLTGTSRCLPSRRSAIWDHWLDSPEPHGP
jgi:hypothetical protein